MNPNRETNRNELLRLLEGLEFYRTWMIAAITREKGAVTQADLNEIVMPGSFFLDLFDATKGRRSQQVIKEVQLWYSHTASDLAYLAHAGDGGSAAADIRQFLAEFQVQTGFSFYAEAGLLEKTARKTLKRGKIANEND